LVRPFSKSLVLPQARRIARFEKEQLLHLIDLAENLVVQNQIHQQRLDLGRGDVELLGKEGHLDASVGLDELEQHLRAHLAQQILQERLDEKNNELQRENSTLKQRHEILNQQNEELQEVTESKNKFQREKLMLEEQNETLRQRSETLRQQNEALQERVNENDTELERANSTLKQQTESLRRQYEESQERMMETNNELQRENAMLKKQNETEQNETLRQQNEVLQERVKENDNVLQRENSMLKEQNETLRQQNKVLPQVTENNNELQREFSKMKAQKDELGVRVNQLQDQLQLLEEWKQTSTSVQLENQRLKEHIAKAQQQEEEQHRYELEQLSQMKAENEILKEQLQPLFNERSLDSVAYNRDKENFVAQTTTTTTTRSIPLELSKPSLLSSWIESFSLGVLTSLSFLAALMLIYSFFTPAPVHLPRPS